MEIPCEVLKINMLSPSQKNIIIGSCLGDAHVERNGKNCRLRFQQALKQKPLLCWKHSILQPHALALREYPQYDKRTKKTYHKIQFDTRTLPVFNEFRDMFYLDGRKRLPYNIINLLRDPLVLAVWFMDDGARRVDSLAFRLHCNDFELHSVETLQIALMHNFNIDSTIHRQQNLRKEHMWSKMVTHLRCVTPVNHTGTHSTPLYTIDTSKTCDNGALRKGYILHIGAKDGAGQRFNNLLKPLVSKTVPTMLYKFF